MSEPEEPEPVKLTEHLTFIPAAMIRRLYTCPDCPELQFISINALGRHREEVHRESNVGD